VWALGLALIVAGNLADLSWLGWAGIAIFVALVSVRLIQGLLRLRKGRQSTSVSDAMRNPGDEG